MQSKSKFLPPLNVLAVAAALCVVSAAASAATVVNLLEAKGSYKLGSDPTVPLLDAKTAPTTGQSVDVLRFPSSGQNSAGMHSYGYTGGNFGSRSSGQGVYDVSGSFKIVMTIANTSSVAQTARFDFNITPGLLSNTIASPLIGSEFLNAGLKFDLRRNGTSVWGSEASLNSNSAGTSFISSGDTSLYARSADTYYSVQNVSRSIDLGVLNAGQSIELSYEIDSFAKGSSVAGVNRVVEPIEYFVPDQWVDECVLRGYGGSFGKGFGGADVTVAPAGCQFGTLKFVPAHVVKVPGYTVPAAAGGSQASSGDPFDVDMNGNIVSDPTFLRSDASRFGASVTLGDVPVGAIPEPETYALMLAGLGLVGWMARRRKDSGV